jgi:hypothetical protein
MEHHESLSTRDLAPPGSATEEVRDSEREAEPARSTATDRASVQAGEPRRADVSPNQEQYEPSADAQGADMPNGSGQPVSAAGEERDDGQPLFSEELSASYQLRWEQVQTRFVDEPRGAVKDADGLVAKLMQQLAEGFAEERERLEAQWDRGEDISTEELRVALTRYRSFFQRLLAT